MEEVHPEFRYSISRIKRRMEKLTDDGKIKKIITRKGKGLTPPPTAIVSILYNTYSEEDLKPINTTYMRKPLKFQLDNTKFIGLNYAVLSMKVSEMSFFFIHSDFPFGKMISTNVKNHVWVVIELLRFSDSRLDSVYDKITMKETEVFSSAQKLTLTLMDNAKCLMSNCISIAIGEYQKGLKILDKTKITNDNERNERNQLKIRILTNLVICFNKENLPKKACLLCNEIYKLAVRPLIPLPAKVYFNHGKALYAIGDYRNSFKKFLKAQKLEPRNSRINDEIKKVSIKVNEEKKREQKLARIYLESEKDVKRRCESINVSDNSNVNIEFNGCIKSVVSSVCLMLKKSNETSYKINFINFDDEHFQEASNVARQFGYQVIKNFQEQSVCITK